MHCICAAGQATNYRKKWCHWNHALPRWWNEAAATAIVIKHVMTHDTDDVNTFRCAINLHEMHVSPYLAGDACVQFVDRNRINGIVHRMILEAFHNLMSSIRSSRDWIKCGSNGSEWHRRFNETRASMAHSDRPTIAWHAAITAIDISRPRESICVQCSHFTCVCVYVLCAVDCSVFATQFFTASHIIIICKH